MLRVCFQIIEIAEVILTELINYLNPDDMMVRRREWRIRVGVMVEMKKVSRE